MRGTPWRLMWLEVLESWDIVCSGCHQPQGGVDLMRRVGHRHRCEDRYAPPPSPPRDEPQRIIRW